MKRLLLIGLFFLFPFLLQATALSSKGDSLQPNDSARLRTKVLSFIKLSEKNRDKSVYDCKQYFRKAMDLARENDLKNLMGLANKSMGISYFYWADMKKAFQYFKKGLYYYKLSGYKEGQSNCLNDMGLVYEGWAKFDSAAYYYKASYLIEKELGNKEGEATSLINMGNIDYYRKDYHGALSCYFQSLKKYIQTGNNQGIAMAYNSIAIIYSQVDDFKKALNYLEKARKIYSSTGGDIRRLSRVLNNMASIYSEHFMEYKKAMILYEKALKIKEELGDKEGIALLKCNIGLLYSHMDNLSLANKYFDESLNLYEEIGDKTGMSMVHHNKGKALQNAGLYREALKEFQKSLAISLKIDLKNYTINNYLGMFKCYAALGKYNDFNKYFALYEQSRDTITENLEKYSIKKLEAQFKIDTLLRQRKRLKEEGIRKEITIRNYHLLSIGLFLIIIILVLALFLYKRARKEAEKYDVND